MTRIHSRCGNRAAFTLIELMVVVLIIAILVSLISSAVVMAMQKIPETQTRTEITQMEEALQAFMADFQLTDPPPSVLYLSPTNPLSTPSGPFLQKLFGRNLGAGGITINWGGTNGGGTLTGEQCLVFYLGGINNQGFSYNTINPTPVTGGKNHGPYFTFQASRLMIDTTNTSAPGFPVYVDPWQTKTGPYYNNVALTFPQLVPTTLGGSPYAYFSSQGINNNPAYGLISFYSASPYLTGIGQYTNPNTYQIISAGKNGVFGGGLWNPSGGVPAGQPGADDQANFSSKPLGAGQQ